MTLIRSSVKNMHKPQIIRATDSNVIDRTVAILRNGGTVVYPTETCYGIGVDATNTSAVNKLLSYKSRREGKPLSIAVHSKEMAEKYAVINKTALNLYKNYLPGPLTVVSKGRCQLAPGIESEYGTVGIRIPKFPLILSIIKAFGKPITATSANPSYQPKPYSIESLLSHLPERNVKLIDLIIDAGHLPHNETSTVVDTTLDDVAVIRQGQLSFSSDTSRFIFDITTNSDQETQNFGSMVMLRYLENVTERPIVFLLRGELGAGKTQFAKGIARTLRIKSIIKSPTFALVHEYPFNNNSQACSLVHIDTWRISTPAEIDALRLKSYFKKNTVVVIEWADKFFGTIFEQARKTNALILKVHFSHVNENVRTIQLEDVSRD